MNELEVGTMTTDVADTVALYGEVARSVDAAAVEKMARRWWSVGRRELWGRYVPETAARCEMALCVILRHRFMSRMPSVGPFPVSERNLVQWGVCGGEASAGRVLEDLEAAGVLEFSHDGWAQWWRMPPAVLEGRASARRAVPAVPSPVFAGLSPLLWSVWVSVSPARPVDGRVVADGLGMDDGWTVELLEDLEGRGLVEGAAGEWRRLPA